jgi:hypothetical protein
MTAPAHLGESMGTDFFSVREQFTEEQWERFTAGMSELAIGLVTMELHRGDRDRQGRRLRRGLRRGAGNAGVRCPGHRGQGLAPGGLAGGD